jgi:hypothetical protein
MKTFRERLDAANNARLIAYAVQTPAAYEHAETKWREFVETEERRVGLLTKAADAIDDVERRFGDEYEGRLGELYAVRDEIRAVKP